MNKPSRRLRRVGATGLVGVMTIATLAVVPATSYAAPAPQVASAAQTAAASVLTSVVAPSHGPSTTSSDTWTRIAHQVHWFIPPVPPAPGHAKDKFLLDLEMWRHYVPAHYNYLGTYIPARTRYSACALINVPYQDPSIVVHVKYVAIDWVVMTDGVYGHVWRVGPIHPLQALGQPLHPRRVRGSSLVPTNCLQVGRSVQRRVLGCSVPELHGDPLREPAPIRRQVLHVLTDQEQATLNS